MDQECPQALRDVSSEILHNKQGATGYFDAWCAQATSSYSCFLFHCYPRTISVPQQAQFPPVLRHIVHYLAPSKKTDLSLVPTSEGRMCWSGLAYLWGGELGFVSIDRGNQEHVLQDRRHVLSHDLLLVDTAVVLQGDDDRVWRGLEQDSNIHHQWTLQFHQSIAIDINPSAVFSGNDCVNSRVLVFR